MTNLPFSSNDIFSSLFFSERSKRLPFLFFSLSEIPVVSGLKKLRRFYSLSSTFSCAKEDGKATYWIISVPTKMKK
jgi:hypothetical protein